MTNNQITALMAFIIAVAKKEAAQTSTNVDPAWANRCWQDMVDAQVIMLKEFGYGSQTSGEQK
jgi:hypothetical protein